MSVGPGRPAILGRLVVVAALGLLVACSESSRVDPEATVTISGEVRNSAGEVVEGRPVSLGTGVSIGDGTFGVLTLGLSCTTGSCSGDVWDTTTGADGRYVFTLEGQDTQSSFGEAESVLVSVSGTPAADEVSGPVTTARFLVQSAALSVPSLELVDAGLLVEGGDTVDVRWQSGRSGPYELRFEADEPTPVWTTRTVEPAATVDPRLLEDTAGRVVVGGRYEDAIEGSDVEMTWRSAGLPYVAGAGPPPSRGRACSFIDATRREQMIEPCALTDGDLDSAPLPPMVCQEPETDAACTPAIAAVVDLGRPMPVELVVVRGCEGGCAVEVSADGTAYRPVDPASEGFGSIILDGQPVRSVRVGLGEGVSGLREVSVWGPRTGEALRAVDDDRRSDLSSPYVGSEDGHGIPLIVALVAAFAIVTVLVGAGFLLGRRRSGGP